MAARLGPGALRGRGEPLPDGAWLGAGAGLEAAEGTGVAGPLGALGLYPGASFTQSVSLKRYLPGRARKKLLSFPCRRAQMLVISQSYHGPCSIDVHHILRSRHRLLVHTRWPELLLGRRHERV